MSRRDQELKKGYKCPYCQKYNEFSVWVFAHWDIVITHKCDCGKVIPLLNGNVLFNELEFTIEDLDNEQAVMYNSLVMVLNSKMQENHDTPIEDVFFNIYGDMIYKGIKPSFISSSSNKKMMKKIQSEIIKFVLDIL